MPDNATDRPHGDVRPLCLQSGGVSSARRWRGLLRRPTSRWRLSCRTTVLDDRTFEIMREMAAAYEGPHEVKVQKTAQNLGLGSHINIVAEIAEGEFVVLAAGDDISHPERVSVLTDAWLKSGRRMLAMQSGFRDLDKHSVVLKTNLHHSLPDEGWGYEFAQYNLFIVGATGAYDIRVFRAFPPLDAYVVHEDRVLPYRALLLGGKVGSVNECLVDYRRNVGISASYRHTAQKDATAFSRRALSDNLQKLVDAQHADNRGEALYLVDNIRRYGAELHAAQAPSNLATLVHLIRHAGLFWGLRAFAKTLFRNQSRRTRSISSGEKR